MSVRIRLRGAGSTSILAIIASDASLLASAARRSALASASLRGPSSHRACQIARVCSAMRSRRPGERFSNRFVVTLTDGSSGVIHTTFAAGGYVGHDVPAHRSVTGVQDHDRAAGVNVLHREVLHEHGLARTAAPDDCGVTRRFAPWDGDASFDTCEVCDPDRRVRRLAPRLVREASSHAPNRRAGARRVEDATGRRVPRGSARSARCREQAPRHFDADASWARGRSRSNDKLVDPLNTRSAAATRGGIRLLRSACGLGS